MNKDILIKLITDQLIDLGTTIDRQLAYSLELCIDELSGIISKWCGDGFKETEDNLYEIIIDIFTKLLSTKKNNKTRIKRVIYYFLIPNSSG
mgnify:CR=1 FL=1